MPKSFRKLAKQLIGQAYKREQNKALETLSREFDRWKSGEIDCWELTDVIHRFHDGESRDLYKIYEMGDIKVALARAIALGIIGEEEVPADLREPMRPMIEFFRGELTENERHLEEEPKQRQLPTVGVSYCPPCDTWRTPGGVYPTPTSTMVLPWPSNVSGITSIPSGESVCSTSQPIPANTVKESLML